MKGRHRGRRGQWRREEAARVAAAAEEAAEEELALALEVSQRQAAEDEASRKAAEDAELRRGMALSAAEEEAEWPAWPDAVRRGWTASGVVGSSRPPVCTSLHCAKWHWASTAGLGAAECAP